MNWYSRGKLILGQTDQDPYLAAIESGNTALAQELVTKAAQAAGYNIQACHSTNALDFTVFRTGGLSCHFGTEQAAMDRQKDLDDFSSHIGRPVKQSRVWLCS